MNDDYSYNEYGEVVESIEIKYKNLKMTDINKELVELFEMCWHEPDFLNHYCVLCGTSNLSYPDFTTDSGKIELLRILEQQGKLALFMVRLIYVGDTAEAIDWDNNVPYDYLKDTTGRLAQAAVEFLRKEVGHE